MSTPYLPPEMLDHIVDLLHDKPETLKKCCLVSNSWVPRTRKHLFATVRFGTKEDLESWKETFPNPATSPAHYAETLLIDCPYVVTAADADAGGWIKDFSRVVNLALDGQGIVYGNESGLLARQLLSLPDGIHFRKLTLTWGRGKIFRR